VSHADYIAKLKKIRDQLRAGHIDTVMSYRKSNAREDLPKILSSYESVEVLDRIIAAEEARSWEADNLVDEATVDVSDGADRPLV
jgi:hypothetical protein